MNFCKIFTESDPTFMRFTFTIGNSKQPKQRSTSHLVEPHAIGGDTGSGLVILGVRYLMDYIERVLEKLKHWAGKLIEALLGPEMQPEVELIPIPVDDRVRHRR
jgi:hypothetical protein